METENPKPFLITKAFLEKILSNNVVKFTMSAGVPEGNNNLGNLISVEVLEANKSDEHAVPLFLMVKSFPRDSSKHVLLKKLNSFWKEYVMYTEIIPKLQNCASSFSGHIMRESCSKSHSLSLSLPRLIYGSAINYLDPETCTRNDDENLIVMVDLNKTSGFTMENKYTGLNYDQCTLVMKELAKLHALSWGFRNNSETKEPLRNKYPTLISYFKTAPLIETKATLAAFWNKSYRDCLETFKHAYGEDSHLVTSLKNVPENAIDLHVSRVMSDPISENDYEKLLRINPNQNESPLKDPWTVLCHGDLWVNNILFKNCEKSGKPTGVAFIDLQLSFETCPTVDLIHFFFTSTTVQIRKEFMNQLLEIYHNEFVNICRALKTEPLQGFSLENLRRRVHRSKIFGLINAITVLPYVLQTPEEDLTDKSASRNYLSTAAHERLSDIVQELHDDGVL